MFLTVSFIFSAVTTGPVVKYQFSVPSSAERAARLLSVPVEELARSALPLEPQPAPPPRANFR
jgi:hypothetical protein